MTKNTNTRRIVLEVTTDKPVSEEVLMKSLLTHELPDADSWNEMPSRDGGTAVVTGFKTVSYTRVINSTIQPWRKRQAV